MAATFFDGLKQHDSAGLAQRTSTSEHRVRASLGVYWDKGGGYAQIFKEYAWPFIP